MPSVADGTADEVGVRERCATARTPRSPATRYDTATVTQTSPTEGTIIYKKGGKAIATAKTSVSKDGKTLTVTDDGHRPEGQAMNNVALYTKQ